MARWWVLVLVLCGVGLLMLMSHHMDEVSLIRVRVLTSRRGEDSPGLPSEIEPRDPGTHNRIVLSEPSENTFHPRIMERPSKEKNEVLLTEDVRQECLRSLVTVSYGGRFGNLFMEWASALGVARRLDEALPDDQRRVVALPRDLWLRLTNVFDGLQATSLAEEMQRRKVADGAASCGEIFPRPDTIAAKSTPEWQKAFDDPQRVAGNKSLVLHEWVAFVPAVQSVVEEIRTNLRFKKKFHEPAASRLRSLSDQVSKLEAHNRNVSEVVLVGMHARRTDYDRWLMLRLQRKPADKSYFVRALRWMVWSLRTRTGHRGYDSPNSPTRMTGTSSNLKDSSSETLALPRFVTPPPPQELPVYPLIAVAVVSDDMDWVNNTLIPALQKYITDEKVTGVHVFPAGSPDAIVDLALLSQCNHTIVSYGTYGATGAILSGGWSVVFNLQHSTYVTLGLAKYLPNWVIMS